MTSGWIGVDLDGTLAEYDGWKGVDHIGKVIPRTLEYIRQKLSGGIEVRIFTARASIPEQIPAVKQWLASHGLGMLMVTCTKDVQMIELVDDRCTQVIPNTGVPLRERIVELKAELKREKKTKEYWQLKQFDDEAENALLREFIEKWVLRP